MLTLTLLKLCSKYAQLTSNSRPSNISAIILIVYHICTSILFLLLMRLLMMLNLPTCWNQHMHVRLENSKLNAIDIRSMTSMLFMANDLPGSNGLTTMFNASTCQSRSTKYRLCRCALSTHKQTCDNLVYQIPWNFYVYILVERY